ncbi:hypothetical protein PROVRUST_07849 [Providencia rustigianii DSM 4541]|uniref:Uncharacterized protein n=1 Tax=Providencia rustigianii DSM 4541 TaxID=500637 RepID=D1P6P6_9GAMM|nr:hypothetical protein PROVRUST_07849 [Providencia rustigianii DSM 4541]
MVSTVPSTIIKSAGVGVIVGAENADKGVATIDMAIKDLKRDILTS